MADLPPTRTPSPTGAGDGTAPVAAPPARPVDREALDRDLGFGAVVARESRRRLLNRDGTFNVLREGLGPLERLAPYHSLLVMPWASFLAYIAAFYVVVNVLFALAYWACGPGALADGGHTVPGDGFVRAFFFSVETFATIGYGAVSPVGLAANAVMTVEALVGILAVALVTGLVFARFSRPTARIRFSRHAVIAPYAGGQALMLRLVNTRRTELIQLEARLLLAHMVEQGGTRVRRFDELALERQRVVFFPLAWTVVHPIDASSPMRDLDFARMRDEDAEVLVLLSGVDETNAQVVHARTSYKVDDIICDARFASVFNPPRADGRLSIDVSRLDAVDRLGA